MGSAYLHAREILLRAMSEENVEIARRGYAAWNRADLTDFLEFMASTNVFYTSGIFPSHYSVSRGHDGIRKFWETFHDAWERLDITVAPINFEAVGRGSGVEVRRKFAHLLTVEKGLVIEVRAYADWDAALETAGLRE